MEGVFHEMKDPGYPIEYVEREEFARAFAMAQSDPEKASVLTSIMAYMPQAGGREMVRLTRHCEYTLQVLYRMVSCKYMGRIYSVTFSDNGAAFDPVSADVREKDFEELDTGGMGIKLAKMYSNDMIYARTNGRNVLTMKFNIKNKS